MRSVAAAQMAGHLSPVRVQDRLSNALELYPWPTAADQIITRSGSVLTLKFTSGSKDLMLQEMEDCAPQCSSCF